MKLVNSAELYSERYRVIVSTDIGGSDPDDFQSMVHYLLYADLFDTEGLISSAWGAGRVSDIFEVIEQYEKDYPNLLTHSKDYPTPDYLRSITKQGAIDIAPYKGFSQSTPGSNLIIECAKKEDERPLYILAWGLLEDIAQALHDAPEIIEKLRVYYIGGPNKKWGLNAYEYIRKNFPNLWIIENNSSYRGWFVGGNQEGDLGNASFVKEHIMGHGALGEYFAKHLGGIIKMGDTPSVTYLLNGNPEVPEHPSWGGCFRRVWYRPVVTFHRNTTLNDEVEIFEVMEFVFDGPRIENKEDQAVFYLEVENQRFEGFYCGDGEYRVRFMPKSIGTWSYKTVSKIPELDGLTGKFVSVKENAEMRNKDIQNLTNWWSDILDTQYAEGEHMGAKTVSNWREEYLKDFEIRMDRCLEAKRK